MSKLLNSVIPVFLLIFAIIFNLYFLFPETKIKSEVNDNVFAYGLILRMDKAWDEGHCPLSTNCLPSLLDHWNSSWAMGFPLPHFYQHIPDLTVVIIFRFLNLFVKIPLWNTFEYFKYLMLCLIPLSYFISAKKFGLNNLTAGFTALVSTQISTQYLYGTDLNALTWRGSGMYTQLWGIFFLPLAVSSIYDYLAKEKKSLLQAVIFLSFVISSHVVFGFLALGSVLSVPFVLSLSKNFKDLKSLVPDIFKYLKKLAVCLFFTFLTLSYWLIPLLQDSALRNKSIWDDLNKFDSFGFQQIIKWFLNGQLFDANRLPVLTLIVIIGIFLSLYQWSKSKENKNCQLSIVNCQLLYFPLLFIFWLLLYFGRKTWGPLIDIIPLMEDMHIHRLINGVHFTGLFLIAVTLSSFVENAKTKEINISKNDLKLKIPPLNLSIFAVLAVCLFLIPVFKERKEYMEYNTKLITDYNKFWDIDNKDFQKVLDFLGPPPLTSRLYPGRPGNWGNDFYVGSTKVYLELSQRGYDVFEFLPETWSLNSDIEQYFDETNESHFNVFNVGYYLAPPDQKVPAFAKEVFRSGKYILYKVNTSNFGFIESPLAISANKKTFLNPNIAWLKSDWPKNLIYPTIIYSKKTKPLNENQKSISMFDNTTYKFGEEYFPLLSFNPFQPSKEAPKTKGKIEKEEVTSSSYKAVVSNTIDSLLLLKVTYHPYWKAKLDGNDTQIFMVSPSFMAIKVPQGSHKVEFIYTPSTFKTFLIYLSSVSLLSLFALGIYGSRRK